MQHSKIYMKSIIIYRFTTSLYSADIHIACNENKDTALHNIT